MSDQMRFAVRDQVVEDCSKQVSMSLAAFHELCQHLVTDLGYQLYAQDTEELDVHYYVLQPKQCSHGEK